MCKKKAIVSAIYGRKSKKQSHCGDVFLRDLFVFVFCLHLPVAVKKSLTYSNTKKMIAS